MNYIVFRRSEPRIGTTGGTRGGQVWWRTVNERTGERSAIVVCPKCGALSSLHKHRIEESGTVSPSVRCSNPGGRCTFHAWIRLEDWEEGGRR